MKIALVLAFISLLHSGQGLVVPRLPLRVLLRGNLPPIQPLIVGGVPAVPYEFPFAVSIQRRSLLGYTHSCGGSIYNADYILTAAHCVDGASLNNLNVAAGLYSQSSPGEFEQVRSVSVFVIHPQYTSPTYENDIAIIKVSAPFQLNEQVASIPLVESGTSIPAGTLSTVIGWGSSTSGGSDSDLLRKVNVPIVSDEECAINYGADDIKPSMICAGYPQGGADSCQGDSGGPLFVRSTGVQVGIASWGYGCAAPGYPGVYTEVSFFTEWVRSVAGGQ